ncbi:MAG: hypothetical protein CMG44_03740 [Candidatus Marinimicrobia bacterium]|nr:hypothetical protein [Candidatus Neomarinimicrobiota bacterium]|tara:strand:- start:504 stop:878 length:375 start_codon:yes stop_codon:yes gene_type:complete
MNFKLHRYIIFLFILISGIIHAQPKEPSSNYKYVLRIQRDIEAEVGFYLDEPKTGDLKKVHHESTNYLLLSEVYPNHKALSRRSEKIKKAVSELQQKKYNPNIQKDKKSNIRYHFFYIDEFSND